MFHTERATQQDLEVLSSIATEVKEAGVEIHFKRFRISPMFALLVKKPSNDKGECLLQGVVLKKEAILGLIQ